MLKKVETEAFHVAEYSTDSELQAALKCENRLVRESAAEEIARRVKQKQKEETSFAVSKPGKKPKLA